MLTLPTATTANCQATFDPQIRNATEGVPYSAYTDPRPPTSDPRPPTPDLRLLTEFDHEPPPVRIYPRRIARRDRHHWRPCGLAFAGRAGRSRGGPPLELF